VVSGMPLEVYFRQHIFKPLGMSDTDYLMSATQQSRIVTVHQRKPDGSLQPTAASDPPGANSGVAAAASIRPRAIIWLSCR